MFRLLTIEVFLEQVDFVVLPDALLSSSNQVFGRLSEPHCGVSVKFLQIFSNVSLLGWI